MTEINTLLAEKLSVVTGLSHRQLMCALWLGAAGPFDKVALRDLCKATNSYNSPNFTRNMRSNAEYFVGDQKTGWALTSVGTAMARDIFGVEIQTIATPVLSLADEVEAALGAVEPEAQEEPEIVQEPTPEPELETLVVPAVSTVETPVVKEPTKTVAKAGVPAVYTAEQTQKVAMAYGEKIKPAFQPPASKDRAPTKLGDLFRRLKKEGAL